MRLVSIEAAGFRGIRNRLEFTFGTGFTVICGRNGAGKSSILDAIDFAFTGSIQKYGERKEKQESADDYLWWRGDGETTFRQVKLVLEDDTQTQRTIVRGPNGLEGMAEADLAELLCEVTAAPKNSVQYLCRTSFIRDELIAELSLDLPEADRFELVRESVASADVSDLEKKLIDVERQLKQYEKAQEQQYNDARKDVTRLTAELSETRARIPESLDIDDIAKSLATLLGTQHADAREISQLAQHQISEHRSRVEKQMDLLRDIEVFLEIQQELGEEQAESQLEALEKAIFETSESKSNFSKQIEELESAISKLDSVQPKLSSLAALYHAGSALGTSDGKCPLCDSSVDEEKFEEHLYVLHEEIEAHGVAVIELQQKKDQLSDNLHSVNRTYNDLVSTRVALEKRVDRVKDEKRHLLARASEMGFTHENLSSCLDDIRSEIRQTREKNSHVERLLFDLRSSAFLDQARSIELRLAQAKHAADNAGHEYESAQKALRNATDARKALQRVAGEFVDNRLAAISPLLSELYARLKPHADWTEISYHVRGNIRRFLSLEVGQGLNPRFMFSSGQRRAAGLAFLLAVYLSRPWVRFHTLMLDDPVQHVDDFRALHLAEVLAAIRRKGEQIICTVEDPALAELMARKMGGADHGDGVRIDLEYQPNSGVRLATQRQIPPMPRAVVVSA